MEEQKQRERNRSHFWGDKQVYRFFRKNSDKPTYHKFFSVYTALCIIDSAFFTTFDFSLCLIKPLKHQKVNIFFISSESSTSLATGLGKLRLVSLLGIVLFVPWLKEAIEIRNVVAINTINFFIEIFS